MQRRVFVAGGMSAVGLAALRAWPADELQTETRLGPVRSVIPVVGDGKWIWTEPPKDQSGYLEPRSYSLSIGVELTGEGDATAIQASTPVPGEHPEQKIDEMRLEIEGCEAHVQPVGEGAAELYLAAPQITRGQKIKAIAHYQLTLKKQYLGHSLERFSAQQPQPPAAVRKQYLQNSPGIESGAAEVKKLLAQLRGDDLPHPWTLAERFKTWIGKNIKPQIGSFMGVTNSLKKGLGDCEEMAAIFVALCRAANIPARLVWVPNHNWAEFFLTDSEGAGHWIPAHTACYNWFGWTGVHELVIQKGDRVTPPHERKAQRLLGDWLQWMGKKPQACYVADLKPLPPEGVTDPGPGARSKQPSGEWKLVGGHSLDRYMRNQ